MCLICSSGDGITTNKTPSHHEVSTGGEGGGINLAGGCRKQAFQAWGCRRVEMQMRLWKGSDARSTNTNQKQISDLQTVPQDRHITPRRFDAHALQNVGAHDRPMHESKEQVLSGLWRARHSRVRSLVEWGWTSNGIRVLRSRHGGAQQGNDHRANGRRLRVYAVKLHLGRPHSPISQSPNGQFNRVSGRKAAPHGMGRTDWDSLFYDGSSLEDGLVRRTHVNGAAEQVGHKTHLAKIKEWET